MLSPVKEIRLRSLLTTGVVAVTSFIGTVQAQGQVTSAPTFSASTTGSVTTLTISDATSGASIYYATGGRTPTTHSIQYTGPLTISLPFTISAIAVAPGDSQSTVATTTYSTILGSTSLSTSLNPSVVGDSITYTATVTPSGSSVPPGVLQFYVNGVPLGAPQQLNSANRAAYSTSEFPAAYLSITASFIPTSGAPTTNATSPAVIQGIYENQPQSQYVVFNNAIKPLGSGFNRPYGIAVDAAENVFVADSGNASVKELTAASNYMTVSTLATGFAQPVSVALDSNDDVFVADASANSVYELPASTGYSSKTPLAGGFSSPYGVATAANGDLFVADTGNHAVKWLTQASGYTSPVQVGGTLQYPWSVALDPSNNLFISDIGTHTVNLAYPGSSPSSSYNTSVSIGANGFFSNPYGVAVDANDNLYVSDTGYSSVREISLIDGWTTVSTPGGGLNVPIGVAVDSSDNIFVADTNTNAVREITRAGGNFGSFPVGTTAPFVISMSFFFEAPYTVGSTAILTSIGGGPSEDFSDAGTGTCFSNTPYAGVSTCTVDVQFTPQVATTRSASVELFDTNGNLLAAGPIQGIGLSH